MVGPSNGRGAGSARITALIVDDQRGLAEALAERLALDGFEATVATRGSEGLDELATRTFDVAFVDVRLPDESGISVASKMKERLPGLKVILMTGMADFLDDGVASSLQVDGILAKPWRAIELEIMLRRLVE